MPASAACDGNRGRRPQATIPTQPETYETGSRNRFHKSWQRLSRGRSAGSRRVVPRGSRSSFVSGRRRLRLAIIVKAVTSSHPLSIIPPPSTSRTAPCHVLLTWQESDARGSRKGPGPPNTMGVSAMQTYFDTAATDLVAQASTLNPGLNVSMWNLIAALAAVLSAVQLIPQVRNAIKADELKGISLTTFLVISFTTILWMLYGIHLEDTAIIVANGIACLCALTVSLMKIRSGTVLKRVR
jgi:MtN3 and saliva related transmembrane protein